MCSKINKSERIPWIDLAKGITIVLMVLGHSNLPKIIHYWIFSFHMPLFFILSGMTTNWNKLDSLGFLCIKLKKLGLPFFIYSTICLMVIQILNLSSLSWSNGWGEFALWFVPVLFVALIIVKLINLNNAKIKLLIFFILPIISVTFKLLSINLPWNMSVAPYGAFFIMLGDYLKGKLSYLKFSYLYWWSLITLIFSLTISIFWHLDMAHNQCVPIIPLTIGAISGSLFIFSVSKIIDFSYSKFSNLFQSIGRETFVILAFSQIIIMTINKYWIVNGFIKYAILAVCLYVIIELKNIIVSIWNGFTIR